MKILAIGDPHGKLPKKLDSLIKKNKIDVIICVGDFAFTPKKPWLEKSWKNIKQTFVNKSYRDTVNKLCSYKLPVLTLRGNMYMRGAGRRIADRILRKNKNLINKFTGKIKIKEQNFIFFDVSFEESTIMKKQERDEKTFYKSRILKNPGREKKLNKLLKENKEAILIAHNPPYGTLDKAFDGKHVGSKILLKAIKKHQPKIVLCGHIHESKGKKKIGKTTVYNLGWHGDYVVLEI